MWGIFIESLVRIERKRKKKIILNEKTQYTLVLTFYYLKIKKFLLLMKFKSIQRYRTFLSLDNYTRREKKKKGKKKESQALSRVNIKISTVETRETTDFDFNRSRAVELIRNLSLPSSCLHDYNGINRERYPVIPAPRQISRSNIQNIYANMYIIK